MYEASLVLCGRVVVRRSVYGTSSRLEGWSGGQNNENSSKHDGKSLKLPCSRLRRKRTVHIKERAWGEWEPGKEALLTKATQTSRACACGTSIFSTAAKSTLLAFDSSGDAADIGGAAMLHGITSLVAEHADGNRGTALVTFGVGSYILAKIMYTSFYDPKHTLEGRWCLEGGAIHTGHDVTTHATALRRIFSGNVLRK